MLTRRNTIAVESLLIRQLLAIPQRLLSYLTRLLRRAETTASLLVHLGTRRDAVNSHEEQLLGLDLPEQVIHIREDRGEYLFFG